jgi:hypothetical protein
MSGLTGASKEFDHVESISHASGETGPWNQSAISHNVKGTINTRPVAKGQNSDGSRPAQNATVPRFASTSAPKNPEIRKMPSSETSR